MFVVDIVAGAVYLRVPLTFPHRKYGSNRCRNLDPTIGSGT